MAPLNKPTGLVVATTADMWWWKPRWRAPYLPPRGKKARQWSVIRCCGVSTDEGSIESVQPRRNLFYRRDEIRTKSFAANIDQSLILLAARPEFSERQLTRALIAAEAQGITPDCAEQSDLTTFFRPPGNSWLPTATWATPYWACAWVQLNQLATQTRPPHNKRH